MSSQPASDLVSFTGYTPGSTPFMGQVQFQGAAIANLSSYSFTIEPKSGTASAAVHATYSRTALNNRGYFQAASGSNPLTVNLPIYGLYAGYTNTVSIELQFDNGSSSNTSVPITTKPYTDPTGIYTAPLILKQRDPGTQLGFNFFAVKSALETPVIIDTDGQVRWVGAGVSNSTSTIFGGDEFVIGDGISPTVHQLALTGALTQNTLQSGGVIQFHHNIDLGKLGLLACINTATDTQSIAEEITVSGSVRNVWDLGAILSTYMRQNGDDPTNFVRPGQDWFHMNGNVYDPTDDTVIVSSRENFLIKLDYKTGNIIWIFGDPTKYWYTFPSLRAKAITLLGGGLYPIGQHAPSITSDGLVMVFNDGLGSLNQPTGEPAGESRTYSSVSAYSIDTNSLTAQQVWNFDYGQSIYSSICGSSYELDNSYLVDYATADNWTFARLVGLDSNHDVVFDFQYPTVVCNTSWNAVPVPLDNLNITQ